MKRLFSTIGLLALTLAIATHDGAASPDPTPSRDALLDQLEELVPDMRAAVMKTQLVNERGDRYWNMPLYMGPQYVSQYYLMLNWFGNSLGGFRDSSLARFDVDHFRNLLKSTQLPDGSWYATVDKNQIHGNLDATILNYWALKAMGESMGSDTLWRARLFVLGAGGLAKATAFTKIYLALFRVGGWDVVPEVPPLALDPKNPKFMNLSSFAQWVIPHIVPIAYLKDRRVSKDLGPKFSLRELWGPAIPEPLDYISQFQDLTDKLQLELPRTTLHAFSFSERDNIDYMISRIAEAQQPMGSWGGYTSATLFSLAAYDDYVAVTPGRARELLPAVARGFNFLDDYYTGNGDVANPNAYLGTVCDGRYWDTILIVNALIESGAKPDALISTGDYLARAVTNKGGIPFGFDFEYAPDTDDTAELVTALSHLDTALGTERYRPVIDRAVAWIASMQNNDGGWGAFDRNNVGNPVLDVFADKFKDSAELFDKSSEDVTGHILEAVGDAGLNSRYGPMIERAIKYLRKHQVKGGGQAAGAWMGRWGVNYIYGTGAVLTGLARAGVSHRDPMVIAASQWLALHQNADGGFGETIQSYKDESLAGYGRSTPSQTAWGLMGLIESGQRSSRAARRAVQYLSSSFAKDGIWQDASVVGTGHPGIVYLQYPSYAYAFPLTALARYHR